MRYRAAAVALAGALALSACSADQHGARPGPSTRAATGTPGGRSVAPDSPFVVAAAAVGARSRGPVVSLHALATSTATGHGVPADQAPRQAAAIRSQLQGQIADATRLPVPTTTSAAMLVLALRGYERVAGGLASARRPGDAERWFGPLDAADDGWRRALRQLSTQSGRDLLAGLPALTVPAR